MGDLIRIRIIIIIIRNGAKTISLPTLFGRLNNDGDIKFDIVIGHHWRNNSAFSKFSRCLPFSKWLPKHGITMGGKNSTLSDIIKI